VTALVFNFIDQLTHGRTENSTLFEVARDTSALRSLTRTWFERSSLWHALREAERRSVPVLLTTDHGSIHCHTPGTVYARRDATANLRYKFGEDLRAQEREAAIAVDDLTAWGLPPRTPGTRMLLATGDRFFVYPTKLREYQARYRGAFLHGGVTPKKWCSPSRCSNPAVARSSSVTHSPRRGSTRRLLGYLRPYRLRFSLGLLTTALASLLDGVTLVILIPLLQQIFASAPPAGGGTKLETLVANVLSPLLTGVSPTAATVRLVLLLLVALVLKNALAYVSGQISVQIQESLVRDLRTQLFDHLLRLDLGFFERTRSGQISSRVMQDADASKGVVSAGLASFFQNLVVICTTLLVLTQISWRLTLIALAAAPVLLVTIRTLLKRLRRYSRARADEAGEMTASVAERLGAVKLVRAFGGEERESRRFREQASRYRQRTVRAQRSPR
jgi:hypothetical protein